MKGKGVGQGMYMKGYGMPMGKDKAAPMEHETMPQAAPKPQVRHTQGAGRGQLNRPQVASQHGRAAPGAAP
ncbi:MAG: hypothetical protein Q7S93_12820 [Phenylobacterium sp.]|nr:hypothetical protein [Phenylobacterium sp.]